MVQGLLADRLDLSVTGVTTPGGKRQGLSRRLRAIRPGVPIPFPPSFNDRQSPEGELVLDEPFATAESGHQALAALGRLPAPLHDRRRMRLIRAALRDARFTWRRRRGEPDGTALPWIGPAEIAALSGADDASSQLRFLADGAALAARRDSAQADQAVDDGIEAAGAFGGLAFALPRAPSLGVPSHDYARDGFQDRAIGCTSSGCSCRPPRTMVRGRPICWASPCSPDRFEDARMTCPALPRFDTPRLAQAIEALPEAMLDQLPYGAIRVDGDGIVRVYSDAERRLSGSGELPRLGLDFFAGIAPCMDNTSFRGRIERALATGRLDLEFSWTGDFADAARSLRVRVQSATAGGYWICMLRED